MDGVRQAIVRVLDRRRTIAEVLSATTICYEELHVNTQQMSVNCLLRVEVVVEVEIDEHIALLVYLPDCFKQVSVTPGFQHLLSIGVPFDLKDAVADIFHLAKAKETVFGILEGDHYEEADELKDLLH